MTNDALAVVRFLFTTLWQLFTSWHIPGTNVTPAGAALFFSAAGIGLRFVLGFLGNPGVGASGGFSSFQKVAGSKIIKTSSGLRKL